MKEQARFWFVHARVGHEDLAMAVAAFTERSARMQTRKRLGQAALIEKVTPIEFGHAWVINLGWAPKRSESARTADAVDPVGQRVTG